MSKERFLVVAGIIVDADDQYTPIANYLKALIVEVVPKDERFRFAFHATKIFSGKKPYATYSLAT